MATCFSIPMDRGTCRRERLPTPVSGLENSMDCIVSGVAESQTRLSDFHFQTSSGLPQRLSGKESTCSAAVIEDSD